MKKIIFIFPIAISISLFADSHTAIEDLDIFGETLGENTQNSAIRYKKTIQTTKTPLNAYKLTFTTGNKALLSIPDVKSNNSAYIANLARTELWQRKFCNTSLKPIFTKFNINIISGDLTNENGETQSLALCMKDSLHGKPLAKKETNTSKIIGSWYSDVGSPSFMDTTYTISNEDNQYYIKRKNGDGSEGKYRAKKHKNKYIKLNDKHGAYYVVTDDGLKIYDKAGYIRTAKTIK